ncbi:MAG TPA: glycosyltransferase family 39 protein [Gemmatimonadota bacterium]|nr:glycosyltransferase family 39 protein [Gemmatimonadota bacterium]
MSDWLDRHRNIAGWGLFLLTLLLVGSTLTAPGIAWDEPFYFESAERQVEWVQKLIADGPSSALDRDTVFAMWDWQHYRNPHPPVYKELMAMSWSATRWVFSPLAGFRLAPALLFAALVALAFRWGSAAWSGIGGLGAALSILLMPRLFGHAHFGATETPLMAFCVAASAAAWWAVERERSAGWALAGIAWGLAAGTKFTGVMAGVPFLVWGLWRDPRSTVKGLAVAVPAALATFWALNPMLWVDPGAFLGPWLWESLHRGDYAPIATYYLGETYGFSIPWHHVLVMTLAVTPLGIVLLAGVGITRGLRRRDSAVILAVGTVALIVFLMLLPRAPHHDGVRQFVVLFPFLGMAAGYGLHVLWGAAQRRSHAITILVLVFTSAAVQLAWVHPHYLAYYSELVGGVRGARALGFETTFWMDSYTGPVFDWLNREVPPDGSVFVFGEPVTLELQQTYGTLRRDIRLTSGPPADFMLVQMRQGLMEESMLQAIERVPPAYELKLQGVPLVAIYGLD